MTVYEQCAIIISSIAAALGIPSIIMTAITMSKMRYRLSSKFRVYRHSPHEEDNASQKFWRAEGIMEYVNYSNLDFYITHIIAITQKGAKYYFEQLDSFATNVLIHEYFENIHITPRESDKIPFSVLIPDELKGKNLKLKIYTSARKRPFPGIMESSRKMTDNNERNCRNSTQNA